MIGCQGAWNLCIERTKRHVGGVGAVGLIKNQVEIKRPPQKVDQSFKQGLLKTMQELKMTKTDMVGGSCRQVRKRY